MSTPWDRTIILGCPVCRPEHFTAPDEPRHEGHMAVGWTGGRLPAYQALLCGEAQANVIEVDAGPGGYGIIIEAEVCHCGSGRDRRMKIIDDRWSVRTVT